MTIDKLALYLREEMDYDFSYSAVRYYMLRLGFSYGKICHTIKSGRSKEYVLQWLAAYAQRRVTFADTPDATVVHAYLDETFLHRDETGKRSWYLDDRQWTTGKIPHTRWAIVQVLFSWWEQLTPAAANGPYARGRGRGHGAVQPQYVRRYGHFTATLGTWNCQTKGNMHSGKFLSWLRKVCNFVRDPPRLTGRRCVFHMDNASYHKKKIPGQFNITTATAGQLTQHLLNHAPAQFGLDLAALNDMTRAQLQSTAREVLPATPTMVKVLLDQYGCECEWSQQRAALKN